MVLSLSSMITFSENKGALMPEQEIVTQDVVLGVDEIEPIEPLDDISLVDDVNDEESLINGGSFIDANQVTTNELELKEFFDSLGLTEADAEEIDNRDNVFDTLGQRESSGDYQAVNQFGYLGKYQFGGMALQDLGFKDSEGEWLGKDAINSKDDFLDDEVAQEQAIEDYFIIQEGYLESNGALDYIGTEFMGLIITKEGLLMASHLVGAGAVAQMLKSGEVPEDANGTKATEYLKLGSELAIKQEE